MVKALTVFSCSALLSVAAQFALSSCSSGHCSCPATPRLPEAFGPLPITDLDNFSSTHGRESLPFELTNGTVHGTGDTLHIRYAVDGDEREVIYDVLPSY